MRLKKDCGQVGAESLIKSAPTSKMRPGPNKKIESIPCRNSKGKLKAECIDRTESKSIAVQQNAAKAWDYYISESHLKEIERITNEYRGRIEESSRLRGDKKDPIATIGREFHSSLVLSIRGLAKRVSGRNEQSIASSIRESASGGETQLRELERQERGNNPLFFGLQCY